ncbi:hypothetical protein FRACYDRAFT_248067 [Fragilariopsis cylindrus CCMP1102]|uniref:Uncharacterized protein n=1 Tax=Fragilariopsis cylindrus CCMP1102 TaxID=635003 RepID=A0A1E7EVC9_9STRA|nr:hypothetical protein FRACYDRAFT_248067 [Fragilariopsis cylindrus CCMP1102]|eukprot:OEU09809.1 hypothetical protein FRACYDRAFT_248067 [Fragilariopsis cylindrus CCMP1102]
MKEYEKNHLISVSISSCSGGGNGGGYDGRMIIMESCNCSMNKRRTIRKGTTGQLRQRRRHRIRTRASNRHSLHSSLALFVLAFTSWIDDTCILFLDAQASSDVLVSSNDGIDSFSSFDDNDNSSNNNNSRSSGDGRLKERLSRKVFHVTTAAELNTSPWTKKKKKKKKNDANNSIVAKNVNNDDNNKERIVPISQEEDSSSLLSTTIQKLLPFLQRGLLLFALSSLAVLERNPSSVSGSILMSSSSSSSTTTATAAAAVSQSNFSFSFLPPFAATIMTKFRNNIKNLVVPHRLNWMKLYTLPTELLPSLSSALLIAWVPTLCFQGAWWELSFLLLSFTSSHELRQYLITQIIPTMSSTIQKLLWSEFWKHIWEYMLRPFPYNMLVPTTTSFRQQKYPQQSNNNDNNSSNNNDDNELLFRTSSFQNIRLYLSDVWTKKVNKRIDTWTISSMKAVLQKNVQSSVTSIVEDSFTFTTNDDITRMIEMEEEEEEDSNNNNDNNDNDSEISSLEESEVIAATETESESESEPPPLLPEEEITKEEEEEEEEEVVEEEEGAVDNDAIDYSASSPTETMTTEQQQGEEEDDSNED